MEIHELDAQGLSIREIARRYKPRAKIGSKLDPYTPYLQERLGLGVTNSALEEAIRGKVG